MDPFRGPGWCKFYANGSMYYATDPELRRKAKSWRRSSQKDIVMVMVRDKKYNTLRIQGTGEFWQSDTQQAEFVLGKTIPGTTITRRIEKRIDTHDKAVMIRTKTKEVFAQFLSTVPVPPPQNSPDVLFVIDPNEHVGLWFILECDVESGKYDYYLSPKKV